VKYDPARHHRRSIRLKGYDYTQAGAYFITICTNNRECLFGEVVGGDMRLNDAGRMVESVWNAMPASYPDVTTDAWVVMPNHVHVIVILSGAGTGACPYGDATGHPGDAVGAAPRGRPHGGPSPNAGQPQRVARTLSVPDVVHRFKTMTTKRYADGVKQSGWAPFSGRLWQRNYYEHIVRNEASLSRIRQYIADNPARWGFDRENPAATEPEPEDAWAQ